MKSEKKTKIGVIFGGRSCEHEISILSAASVIAAIDREKFEPVPFAIDRSGVWYLIRTDLSGLNSLSDTRIPALFDGASRVAFTDFDAMVDFAFPLLHGPYGEDGTIQGLFEMMDKPYAGCGVAAAAVSMDKIFTKELWIRAGLPVCLHDHTTKDAWEEDYAGETARIEEVLSYPIFVKPANMGSSVGVSKVYDRAALETAISSALKHDRRIIVEQTVCGREVEIGLIGNGRPEVSAVGEIVTDTAYYDYDSKYRDGGARICIPADLSDGVRGEIEALAMRAYRALDGAGFARIDFFYDEARNCVYLNEMNAIPGFTRYSMFPLLWQEKGVGYKTLIERIIKFGYERHHFAHHRQSSQRP